MLSAKPFQDVKLFRVHSIYPLGYKLLVLSINSTWIRIFQLAVTWPSKNWSRTTGISFGDSFQCAYIDASENLGIVELHWQIRAIKLSTWIINNHRFFEQNFFIFLFNIWFEQKCSNVEYFWVWTELWDITNWSCDVKIHKS